MVIGHIPCWTQVIHTTMMIKHLYIWHKMGLHSFEARCGMICARNMICFCLIFTSASPMKQIDHVATCQTLLLLYCRFFLSCILLLKSGEALLYFLSERKAGFAILDRAYQWWWWQPGVIYSEDDTFRFSARLRGSSPISREDLKLALYFTTTL